jgi:8-oxo-dGTP pyrophosphatase MutT (NUDIX family)
MAGMVRGLEPWEAAIADALERVPRPIPADPRFAPRDALGRTNLERYDRATFPPARPAATLLLLYPDAAGRLTVPLTVRQPELRAHAGEISLPGGAVERADASREATALREAREEVALDPEGVRTLGALDDVWIPVSNYELRPVVAGLPERPTLVARQDEVAAIIELPVAHLLAPDTVTEELIEGPGWLLRAAVYRYDGHRVWGATAKTLAMLATVLTEAGIEG